MSSYGRIVGALFTGTAGGSPAVSRVALPSDLAGEPQAWASASGANRSVIGICLVTVLIIHSSINRQDYMIFRITRLISKSPFVLGSQSLAKNEMK